LVVVPAAAAGAAAVVLADWLESVVAELSYYHDIHAPFSI